jgi:cell division topological specificity factor
MERAIMTGIFGRLFGKPREDEYRGSSSAAKERLQFILVHDRINLSPDRMEAMKREILADISKYVDVEGDNVEIALQKRDRDSLLIAEVPFIKPIVASYDDSDEYTQPHDPTRTRDDT